MRKISHHLFVIVAFILCVPNLSYAAFFDSSASYPVDRLPAATEVADFNGDGRVDIATTNVGSATVSILLSSGYGTFSSAVSYAVNTDPYALVAADFDEDGDLDLAVSDGGARRVSYLEGDGDGTFQAAVDYAVGNSPRGLTYGDFDGDANLDLAVANMDDGTVSILLGGGDGTFAAAVDYASGLYPTDVATGDLDHDGVLDLAVVNSCSGCFVPYNGGNVRVMLGVGDGSFPAGTTYTAKGSVAVVLKDLDSDGWLDVAIARRYGNSAGVLMNKADSTGDLLANVDYATGSNPSDVAVADLDGDGIKDLVVANSGSHTFAYLLGVGDGTFGSASTTATGVSPMSISAYDFNQDGKADVAVADGSDDDLRIFLESSAPEIDALSPTSTTANTTGLTVTVDGSGFSPNSVIRIDDNDRTTSFVSSSRLTLLLPTYETRIVTTKTFKVYNPTTLKLSAGATFTVLSSGARNKGAGLPAEAYLPPAEPQDGFKVVLNGGDGKTTERKIGVILKAVASVEPRATKFSISNDPDFKTASIISLDELTGQRLAWDLCAESGGEIVPIDCPKGEHAVYVKFYTKWGRPSPVIKASIDYRDVPALASLEKPKDSSGAIYAFSRDLKLGSRGEDVLKLQKILNAKGFLVAMTGPGSKGHETTYFGLATRDALARFQEANATEVLKPLGLLKGTGYLGVSTRRLLSGK
ncbi:MAG: FG-GAP-like repeat-containing protein [Patescibacteria group bacterium]|nr:FG-GAP-like repeat-containing protein [Patescibacteria group bacterium]